MGRRFLRRHPLLRRPQSPDPAVVGGDLAVRKPYNLFPGAVQCMCGYADFPAQGLQLSFACGLADQRAWFPLRCYSPRVATMLRRAVAERLAELARVA